MQKLLHIFQITSVLASSLVLFSGCATIVGGSRYYAHITVEGHPNATIIYNQSMVGRGFATIKIKRKDANKVSFSTQDEGCEPQTVDYVSRRFRGWAFFGTIVGWTGAINGIPLPWGIVVDLSTGAVYKPNTVEKGITKIDYKNYNYLIEYKGCK